jgi:hypothetical protein
MVTVCLIRWEILRSGNTHNYIQQIEIHGSLSAKGAEYESQGQA